MRIGGFQKTSLIDYAGKIAAIIFTRGCNFNCIYCHNKGLIGIGDHNDDITPEDILSFLETRKGKLDAVVITGGEPTLQPDLIPFMRKIKELGFLVKLDSNGSNPHVLREVIAQGLADYIAMDLKAPLEKYKNITGREIDTSKIQESIDLIKNSGIEHEFRTTVHKALLSEDDLLQLGELAGTSRLILQKYVPQEGLEQLNAQEDYTSEDFLRIKNALANRGYECSLR